MNEIQFQFSPVARRLWHIVAGAAAEREFVHLRNSIGPDMLAGHSDRNRHQWLGRWHLPLPLHSLIRCNSRLHSNIAGLGRHHQIAGVRHSHCRQLNIVWAHSLRLRNSHFRIGTVAVAVAAAAAVAIDCYQFATPRLRQHRFDIHWADLNRKLVSFRFSS